MTDLNKEREQELFNAFVQKELPELFEKHSNSNFFAKIIYDSMFGAWLGAKAQAVPDGYVVVPKEPTREMLKAGIHSYLHQDSIKEKDGSTSISFKYIYQEMIEASESGAEG